MTFNRYLQAPGTIRAFAAIIAAGMVSSSRHVRAHDDDDDERDEVRIHRGFDIAPEIATQPHQPPVFPHQS